MRVDPRDEFEQSSDYEDALEEFKHNELYKCDDCQQWFDEGKDIIDGSCHHCRALEKQREQTMFDKKKPQSENS